MGVLHDLSSAFKAQSVAEILGLESNIATLVSSSPQLLGPNLKLVHREFETGTGVIDLVFKDGDEVSLAGGVKEIADQEAVGQPLKQTNGMKDKLDLTSLRKAIVALRTSGNVQEACRNAGIDLYLIAVAKAV